MMTRMLEAVRKGYWDADDAVIADLGERVRDLITELELQCTPEDCHDPILTQLVKASLVPAPMAAPTATPASAAPPVPESRSAAEGTATDAAPGEGAEAEHVQGYAMEEVHRSTAIELDEAARWLQIAGFALFCLAFWIGFRRARPVLGARMSPRATQ